MPVPALRQHRTSTPTPVLVPPFVGARPDLAFLVVPDGSLVLRLALHGHASFDTHFRTHELPAVLGCVEASVGLLPDDRRCSRLHDVLRFQLSPLLDAARDRLDDDPRLVAGAVALWLALHHPRHASLLHQRLGRDLADSAQAQLLVRSLDHGRLDFRVGTFEDDADDVGPADCHTLGAA